MILGTKQDQGTRATGEKSGLSLAMFVLVRERQSARESLGHVRAHVECSRVGKRSEKIHQVTHFLAANSDPDDFTGCSDLASPGGIVHDDEVQSIEVGTGR